MNPVAGDLDLPVLQRGTEHSTAHAVGSKSAPRTMRLVLSIIIPAGRRFQGLAAILENLLARSGDTRRHGGVIRALWAGGGGVILGADERSAVRLSERTVTK